MSEHTLKLRLKIELPDGTRLGYGKVDLLKAIQKEASISAAARALGMSYRRAWSLINEMNTHFAEPVVETHTGGARRGGAEVTSKGQYLIDCYELIQTQAEQATQELVAQLAAQLKLDD
ncbi:transcriptional regulator [Terasakiispira papahanaumokuakeensis]|uniref:Transcriptional regulator n=2 Tax=Terasakiispira papahanaumokuakeensis TaxID=197479 RepID=A0A1E2VEB4_9GAMM|nr:transcriptional regulator [Terasakiispira papahanaumokuakeensis]